MQITFRYLIVKFLRDATKERIKSISYFNISLKLTTTPPQLSHLTVFFSVPVHMSSSTSFQVFFNIAEMFLFVLIIYC